MAPNHLGGGGWQQALCGTVGVPPKVDLCQQTAAAAHNNELVGDMDGRMHDNTRQHNTVGGMDGRMHAIMTLLVICTVACMTTQHVLWHNRIRQVCGCGRVQFVVIYLKPLAGRRCSISKVWYAGNSVVPPTPPPIYSPTSICTNLWLPNSAWRVAHYEEACELLVFARGRCHVALVTDKQGAIWHGT